MPPGARSSGVDEVLLPPTYIGLSATLYRDRSMPSPRMTTQTLTVLSTMLSAPDADWYGLELCKRVGLKPGTIYPILDRLLKVEWLERRWEKIDPKVEGRPRRRLYHLTGAGALAAREALDEHLASLRPIPAESWRPAHRPRPA
jgi:PadR family transcriptional regulator, regulatory protein PadR